MLVINTNQYNGVQIGVNVFYAAPIISGEYIGKYAADENSLNDFPEIFNNIEYEKVDLPISVFQKNATPPSKVPFYCEIPLEYQLPFNNNVFKLNEFEVPLETIENTKSVNLAYFEWKEFRFELDTLDKNGNFKYQALKDALMPLWDFVDIQAMTILPWLQDPEKNQLSPYIIYIP